MNYFKEETEKDTMYFLAYAIIKSVERELFELPTDERKDIAQATATANNIIAGMFFDSTTKEQSYEIENLFFEVEMFIRRECKIEMLGSPLILGVLYSLSES